MRLDEVKSGSAYTLADCGIFAALATVLVLISAYVPLLGFFASFLWAVPIIIVVLRRGISFGILTAIVVFMLSLLLTGPMVGIISGITVGLFGIAYGICFKKEVSPVKALLIGTVAAGLITLLTVTLAVVLGSVPITSMIDSAEEAFREVFAAYDEMGVLGQVLPAGVTSEEYIQQMLEMFHRLLPGVFIIMAMSTAALNYVFAALVLRKFRFDVRPLPPFREWHLPWWIMWGVVIILGAYLMGKQFDGEYYFAIAQNILYIYVPIFFVSGVSVITYFFHFWKLSNGKRVIIWVIAALFASFSLPFILLMGAVDVLLDYRTKLRKALHGKN